MTTETKSTQVRCPRCEKGYVLQVPNEREFARFTCVKCDERITVPSAPFRADESML